VAREAMISIGCIQAKRCHKGNCPTGIATHNKWLRSGLIPELKAERCNNYIRALRKEILQITHACGYDHPCQMTMNDIEMAVEDFHQTQSLRDIFDYEKTPVSFDGMKNLQACQYLGGKKEEIFNPVN
jgi:glutamate synthase-like protein